MTGRFKELIATEAEASNRADEVRREVELFARKVEAEHGLSDLWLSYVRMPRCLVLHMIRVAPENQHQGRADAALTDILAFADAAGISVALTPEGKTFGSSQKRLEAWYRRRGFRWNRGRSKDFRISQTMIRRPGGAR